MNFRDLLKKNMKKEEAETVNRVMTEHKEENMKSFEGVAPENIGKLDMVIAFDTTGSMAAYIDARRCRSWCHVFSRITKIFVWELLLSVTIAT